MQIRQCVSKMSAGQNINTHKPLQIMILDLNGMAKNISDLRVMPSKRAIPPLIVKFRIQSVANSYLNYDSAIRLKGIFASNIFFGLKKNS